MHRLSSVRQRYKHYVVSHPIGTLVLGLVCLAILVFGAREGKILQTSAYLGAVMLCVLVTDLVVGDKMAGTNTFVIKRPAGRELTVILLCMAIGAAFLCIRFFGGWENFSQGVKIAMMPLMIFTLPIALALIYLFIYKYKIRELGINLNYWYLPLFLHVIWGGISLIACPENIHFAQSYHENGLIGFLLIGLLGAALSEEFSRMLVQTRLGAVTNNMFIGLFVASVIWSAMHIPISYGQNPENFSASNAFLGTIFLVPHGMFWGYLTYRTQSLIPVLLMHGFNLWGLQNF